MIQNVSIIIRHPWGDERAALGVRTAFATQSGGFDTSLVFLGNGVYNFSGDRPAYLSKLVSMFLENDGKIFCLESDLNERELSSDALAFEPEVIDAPELADIMDVADSVNVF